jgi:hypothetical protein
MKTLISILMACALTIAPGARTSHASRARLPRIHPEANRRRAPGQASEPFSDVPVLRSEQRGADPAQAGGEA